MNEEEFRACFLGLIAHYSLSAEAAAAMLERIILILQENRETVKGH